jgi:pyruvate/2-oxoglutarate/acetoin dehydrogenase E1 component
MRKISMREALREAMREEMLRDPTVYIWGENVEGIGGGFAICSNLSDEFGERVKDSPLAEAVIAGSAVGAAFTGLRPIVEIMFSDFAFVCGDELFHKMAKSTYIFDGQDGFCLPIVVRMKTGGYVSIAAEHSQTPLAYFLHTPGLKVVFPTTANDAKGLLKTAVRDNNPVMFFEHILHYGTKGEVPEEEYLIPFGEAKIRREGSDLTVVAIGYMVDLALKAAEELAKEGVELEVIDPRTLMPFDMDTVMQSIEKTGGVVFVDEDTTKLGFPAELMTQIYESFLEAGKPIIPMGRVGSADVPIPYSPPLEQAVLPSPKKIVEKVKQVLAF